MVGECFLFLFYFFSFSDIIALKAFLLLFPPPPSLYLYSVSFVTSARSTSEGEGVVLCDLRESMRERRGGVGLCREQRAERAEKESRKPHAFWKMVYGKIFRKPFSSIYKAIFRSNYRPFLLTSILQRPKRLKMLKTFYENILLPNKLCLNSTMYIIAFLKLYHNNNYENNKF